MDRLHRNDLDQQPAAGLNIGSTERRIYVLGGAVLSGFALLKESDLRLPALLGGAVLLFKGLTGHSPLYTLLGRNTAISTNPNVVAVPHEQGFHITRSVTINRPASELYAFWRDPLNLPNVIDYIESVQVTAPDRAHWTVKLPGGLKTSFEVEVYTDQPNEVISWRSVPDSSIKTAGSIRFRSAGADRGTSVTLTMEFVPPGGPLGQAALKLFGDAPAQYIAQYLREFKQMMETGEKATTEGQTSGRVQEVTI